MSDKPNYLEWKALYESAKRFRKTSPWEWMTESDLIGIENPEDDSFGFISIMGKEGEHFGVSLYLGIEGLHGFWRMQETYEAGWASHDDLFEIPQLQASFEDKDQLEEEDLKIIRKLSLKFQEKNEWPFFRSWKPGYFPWFLEAHEARFLTHALDQSLDVALRFRHDEDLLYPGDVEYLFRIPRIDDSGITWTDRIRGIEPPEEPILEFNINRDVFESVISKPQGSGNIEIDLFLTPTPVGPRGERPVLPYMLLAVDGMSGMVIGFELLKIETRINDMLTAIPGRIMKILMKIGELPETVFVRSPRIFSMLQTMESDLPFKIVLDHSLPNLEDTKEELLNHLLGIRK